MLSGNLTFRTKHNSIQLSPVGLDQKERRRLTVFRLGALAGSLLTRL